jgi:hypothetical protein
MLRGEKKFLSGMILEAVSPICWSSNNPLGMGVVFIGILLILAAAFDTGV